MKKILIMMIALTLSAGVFAQKRGGFRGHPVRVYTYVTPAFGYGFNYGYPLFGYPYFGYPFAYGPYSYAYGPMSSYKLNAQINAVKSEYRYKIRAARKDKSVSSAQRKQNVLQLKSEREKAIGNVQKNYYQRRMNRMTNPQGMNNSQNQQPGTNNTQSQPNNNNNSESNQNLN